MQGVIEERYIGRLPLLLGALVLLVLCALLSVAIYLHRPAAASGPKLSDGAFVMVFEVGNCELCEKFRSGIGRRYQRGAISEKAPMRFFDISDTPVPKRFSLRGEVYTFPTIVVFDPWGREMDRVNGPPATIEALEKMTGAAARRVERDLARQAN
ncbi:MAG: hypothetical protein KGP27_10615 [Hyphomicrobiales bacterium]|nr:hypothetical protein [Hyphomicrobiales bacterium]